MTNQPISLKLEDAQGSNNEVGQNVLRQKHVTLKIACHKKVAMKASKSISELLKEAWRIKTKVAAQAKKCLKAIKKMSNLAPSTKTILFFED